MQFPKPLDVDAARKAAKQSATSWLVLIAGLLMMLVVSFVVEPKDIESGRVMLSPTCPSKALFGWECPTCGMTRGFAAMSRGLVGEALRYNRASPLMYALAWLGLAWGAVGLVRSVRAMGRIGPGSQER